MNPLSTTQQKTALAVLALVLISLIAYRWTAQEPPQTRPLTFTPGMKAEAPVRRGITASGGAVDPIALFLERRAEKYPGMVRDIFRKSEPASAAKTKPVVTQPAATVAVVTQPASTVPERTPEEIAAEAARADLARFRFLGYLTDKDSSLFLSKDGELFIVKSGDKLLKSYQVKTVGKDHVILLDTITKVEARIELTGSGGK